MKVCEGFYDNKLELNPDGGRDLHEHMVHVARVIG